MSLSKRICFWNSTCERETFSGTRNRLIAEQLVGTTERNWSELGEVVYLICRMVGSIE